MLGPFGRWVEIQLQDDLLISGFDGMFRETMKPNGCNIVKLRDRLTLAKLNLMFCFLVSESHSLKFSLYK